MNVQGMQVGRVNVQWTAGLCAILASVLMVWAVADARGEESALSEGKRQVEDALGRLMAARRAQSAGLVSGAWVNGIQDEAEIAKLTLEMLQMEEDAAAGTRSQEEADAAAADIHYRLELLEEQAARRRLELARGLAEKGLLAPGELKSLEDEAAQAEIEVSLARLEGERLSGAVTPADYAKSVGPLVERHAALEVQQARAEMDKVQMLFASGQAMRTDVLEARSALAEAEYGQRDAAVRVRVLRGEIADAAADRERAALRLAAAKERVDRCREMLEAARRGKEFGLMPEEMTKYATDALARAEEEQRAAEGERKK